MQRSIKILRQFEYKHFSSYNADEETVLNNLDECEIVDANVLNRNCQYYYEPKY